MGIVGMLDERIQFLVSLNPHRPLLNENQMSACEKKVLRI